MSTRVLHKTANGGKVLLITETPAERAERIGKNASEAAERFALRPGQLRTLAYESRNSLRRER